MIGLLTEWSIGSINTLLVRQSPLASAGARGQQSAYKPNQRPFSAIPSSIVRSSNPRQPALRHELSRGRAPELGKLWYFSAIFSKLSTLETTATPPPIRCRSGCSRG
jgi:hypothetical protein